MSLPSTGLGTWSAWLLSVSIVLVLVNNIAVMPLTERSASLELAQSAFNLAVFLCLGFAGATGLLAIISRHERSWVAFTSVLLLAIAVAFNVGPFLRG